MTEEERKKQRRDYIRAKKRFLAENPWCAVYPTRRSTQIHHSRGRLGPLLTDERFWIPVSQTGHNWIHNNVERARNWAWEGRRMICEKGEWNTVPNTNADRLKRQGEIFNHDGKCGKIVL